MNLTSFSIQQDVIENATDFPMRPTILQRMSGTLAINTFSPEPYCVSYRGFLENLFMMIFEFDFCSTLEINNPLLKNDSDRGESRDCLRNISNNHVFMKYHFGNHLS